MLKENTSSIIARPGANERMGWVSKYSLLSLTILPQAAMGGSIPIHRKLSPASVNIVVPNIMVITTMSVGMALVVDCPPRP
jgi:hypothetical protein